MSERQTLLNLRFTPPFAVSLIGAICCAAAPTFLSAGEASDPISSSAQPPYAAPTKVSENTKTLSHFLRDTYPGKLGFVQNGYNIQPLAEADVASNINVVKLKGRDTAPFVLSHCNKTRPDFKRGYVALRVVRIFPSSNLAHLGSPTSEVVNVFRNENWVKTPESETLIPQFGPNLQLNINSWEIFTNKHLAIEFRGIPWHATTERGGLSSREYPRLWEEKMEPKDFDKYLQLSARDYRVKYNAMLIGFAETTTHGSINPPDFELENMHGCLAAIISVRHPWLERYHKNYLVSFEGTQ